MISHLFLIPILPFAAAFLIPIFGRWLPQRGAWLSIAAVMASFIIALDLLLRVGDGSLLLPHAVTPVPWFSVGLYEFVWGFQLDGLSLLMGLIVTGVSLLIQIYSLGYMSDAPRLKQYFASLSLFTSGMLLVVFSDNYFQLFIGWELMGLCSYLLIGYDWDREAAGKAAVKAFLTTRIGDLGFYAALLTIFIILGTFNFVQIEERLLDGGLSSWAITLMALLIFGGVVGKSAQFPLHVWLPDAMEGPTPVSALIHSATMVAAGVYLTARSYVLFSGSPMAMHIVSWVGGGTSLMAALFGVATRDIKRMLAFSTISQLGLMLLGLGVSGYSGSVMHMATHAAFKALLFLAAGSVIHAVHTNDIWKMGSLSKQMAVTFTVFLFGALALAAIPPFAGFFSKDKIIENIYLAHQPGLLALAYSVSGLTAFYVFRVIGLVFLGQPKERDRFAHAHESPWVMTIPMIILAFFAVSFGWILSRPSIFETFFSAPLHHAALEAAIPAWVMITANSVAVGGMGLGLFLYTGDLTRVESLARVFHPIHHFLFRQAYLDEAYELFLLRPVRGLAAGLDWFDRQIIDRIFVDGFKTIADELLSRRTPEEATASGERSGRIQNYLMIVTFAALVLLFWNSH